MERPLLYFKNDTEWRTWLAANHHTYSGVYVVFYKVNSSKPSMRWEEAVKVALYYGWIDSTVKRIDDQRRKQLFTPRKSKSVWSKVNKAYIEQLIASQLMHTSGLKSIEVAKQNGSWTSLDDVENFIIPKELQEAFLKNKAAFVNYNNFAPSYRKSYLYWLNQAKRPATRQKRIAEIISLCAANKKNRANSW